MKEFIQTGEQADVVLLAAAEPVLAELGTARKDYEMAKYAGFSEEEMIQYADVYKRQVLGWKLNPMFGAAAMSLSSFCVVSNALRLNFFDLHRADRDRKIKAEKKKKEKKIMEKTLKIEGMMLSLIHI